MLCRYDAKKGEKSQLARSLAEDHSPEMQQWLLAEMKQNRSKKVAKTKVSEWSSFLCHNGTRPMPLPANLPGPRHDAASLMALQQASQLHLTSALSPGAWQSATK